MTPEEELKKDCRFNPDTMTDVISNIPIMSSKWINRWMTAVAKLRKAEDEFAALKMKRFIWYRTQSPLVFDLKDIRETCLPGDDELSLVKLKVDMLKKDANTLEQYVKVINGLQWNIKNYIEWQKFQNGIV